MRLTGNVEELGWTSGIAYRLKAIEAYETGGLYQDAINEYMEIAEIKQSKNDVFAACSGAWSISDTVLSDWHQSEYLREYFINRFPESNEAYKLRLQVIGFYESEIFSDTLAAGHMYLDLHDNHEEIDMAGEEPSKLYLKAIKIFTDFQQIDLVNHHMLQFEKQYPDHPMSIEFLKNVAIYYNDNGMDAEFEDLARYIYRKDPSVDLLTDIAISKFRNLKTQIDEYFALEEYDRMDEKITAFKNLDNDYKNEGLVLPLDSIYEQFQYYKNYQQYYIRYDREYSAIETDFLNQTPDQLIRVNEMTEWKKHIINNRRVNKVMDKCEEIRTDVVQLIKDGIPYDIDTQYKTKALYLVGLCYEHGSQATSIQIQHFADVSKQLNNETLNANPIKQKQYKDNILAQGKKLAFAFDKKALEIYNYMLTSFVDDQHYSDIYTDLAYGKLVEKGLRSPKIYVDIQLDTLWTNTGDYLKSDDFEWIDSLAANKLSLKSLELKRIFISELKPDFVKLDIITNHPLKSIQLNDDKRGRELIDATEIELGWEYSIRFTKAVNIGENEITLGFDEIYEDLLIAPSIAIQYEKDDYEYITSTEEVLLTTDYHWLSTIGDLGDNPQVDSTWIFASDDNFRFFKNQMYGLENTEAIGIWYPLIDTIEIQTCYFAKSFNIDSEVTEASMNFIGQEVTSIWLNGNSIVENREIVLDKELSKAEAQLIKLTDLRMGDNYFVVKVIGEEINKGFIAEIKFRKKKMDESAIDEFNSADGE